MHIAPDAVPDIIPHQRISPLFIVHLNGARNIRDPLSRTGLLDTFIEALPGHLHKPLGFGRDGSRAIGGGTVAVIPMVDGPDVDFDQVALFNFARPRNTVDDLVIDRAAQRGGKSAVSEERGRGAAAFQKPADLVVDLFCCNSWLNQAARQGSRLGGQPASLAHERYLMRRLDLDHNATPNASETSRTVSDSLGCPCTVLSLPCAR